MKTIQQPGLQQEGPDYEYKDQPSNKVKIRRLDDVLILRDNWNRLIRNPSVSEYEDNRQGGYQCYILQQGGSEVVLENLIESYQHFHCFNTTGVYMGEHTDANGRPTVNH